MNQHLLIRKDQAINQQPCGMKIITVELCMSLCIRQWFAWLSLQGLKMRKVIELKSLLSEAPLLFSATLFSQLTVLSDVGKREPDKKKEIIKKKTFFYTLKNGSKSKT